MQDKFFANRAFATLTVTFCLLSVFLMPRPGVCAFGDDDDTDQQPAVRSVFDTDADELQLREDAAVREVNDVTLNEIKQTEAVKRNRYSEELGYVPKGNLLSDDELAAIEKQRAEKERSIRARYGSDVDSLERSGAGASEEQMSEVKWKDQSRLSEIIKPVVFGTVTGIVFYNDKGAALVAGEVVRENDTVLNVKVTRIMPGYVEFEKRGKTWTQEVGQSPPDSVWEKPEKQTNTTKSASGQ